MIISNIPTHINIFGVNFYFYGLIIGIAVITAILYLDHHFKNKIRLYDYLTIIFASFIGARLIFVINNLDNPNFGFIDVFKTTSGGLSIHGAIIGLALSVYYISRIRKINFISFTDQIALIFPISQSIGRLGNFINNELYGKPTNLPWKLFIPLKNRDEKYRNYEYFHPLFLYEILLNLVSFLVLFILYKKFPEKKGFLTSIYLINYGIIRLSLNTLRIQKEFWFGIESSSLLSVVMILVGLGILLFRNKNFITRDKK